MRHHKFFLLLYLGFICSSFSSPNKFGAGFLSVEDGLLNNYVNSIAQDHLGFLWFGTDEGLSRYDGYGFLNMTHNSQDTNSLSHNVINYIFEDSHHQLWVSTRSGLNRLINNQQGFVRYFSSINDTNSLSDSEVFCTYEDSDCNLWIGTGDGALNFYDREKDQFSRYVRSDKKSELRSITEDKQGRLVLGYGAWVQAQGEGGLSIFDKEARRYLPGPNDELTQNLAVMKLIVDHNNDAWIATYNQGFFQYDLEHNRLMAFAVSPNIEKQLPTKLINNILEVGDSAIWLATDGMGVLGFDKEDHSFSPINNPNNKSDLSSNSFINIFEDKAGIFWIGSVNQGILKLDKYERRFDHWAYNPVSPSGLSGKSVMALAESKDGGIWVGMDLGGLNYYDRNADQVIRYHHEPGNANSLSDNVINGLHENSKGELLIGTFLNGFDILDAERQVFTHYGPNNTASNATYIRCFLEDKDDIYWIGSRTQGLIRFDRKTGVSRSYKHDPADEHSIPSNHLTAIMEESNNLLWVATFNGFALFNKTLGTFKSWRHDPDNPNSLSGVEIYAFSKDGEKGIWLGTNDGLNYFDLATEEITHFRTADGLPSNTIKGLLTDDQQQLWIITNFGVSKYSPKTKKIKNYGLGVIGQSYGKNAAIQASDGKLFFGSMNGVVSFFPDDMVENPIPPPVVINQFLIANQVVEVEGENAPLQQPISQTSELTLRHLHKVFSFEFVALNYTCPEKNEYAYKLEGFDEDWHYVGHQRNATYTNINPGEYTFRVKASNNDGLWNEKGASIHITILPPWWKSTWAYAMYGSLLVLLILAVRQTALYRSNLLNAVQIERIEMEKMNELNRMKTNFFTNIFHEFKTPLTLILGPLEKIRTSGPLRPDLQKQFFIMQHNAKRLLRLINFLILSQKNELVGIQLQANQTDLVAFIENIISAFLNRAKEQQINLIFEPSEDALQLWFDREKLEMVFYNLLSNAFKHTQAGGTIEISFMRETVELENAVMQEWITIDIQDTGRGIAPEKLDKVFDSFYKADKNVPGTGIGLSFSKSIVDLHHGEMSATSELGKGSCFTVCLLLGDKHLQKEEMIPAAQNLKGDSIYPLQNKLTKASFMDTPIPELSIKKNSKATILIVEDEYDVLAFLRENLSPNYEIVVAFDGQEGLVKANQCDPDLIISDIMMPRMDGIEFCTKIKSNLSTSHIPILFLTAQSREEDIFKGLDSGADDFIAKPFNLRVLETKINNIIITRQMLKERFKKELAFGIEDITITSLDEQFISRVVKLIEENIGNPEFNVDSIIRKINMSRSPFFRKIKAITGQTPSEFLRFFKLKRGAQVLLKSGKTIAQVAYEMGYSSPKIFRAHFKKQFGQTPSEYIKAHTMPEERIENTN